MLFVVYRCQIKEIIMADIQSGNALSKRNKLIATVVIVGIVFSIFLLCIYISDPNKGQPDAIAVAKKNAEKTTTDFTINPDSVDSEQNWRNKSEDALSKNATSVDDLKTQVTALEQQLQEAKNSTQVNGKTYPFGAAQLVAPPDTLAVPPATPVVPPPPANVKRSGSRTLPPPPSLSRNSSGLAASAEQMNNNDGLGGAANNLISPPKSSITRIDVSGSGASTSETGLIEKSGSGSDAVKTVPKNVSTYVPAGAFGKIVMLSGVDAPTGGLASSNPVPVLMRIKDAGTLANYFKSDLKECTVIGEAAGDISSERANIRLDTITCILADGTIIEEPVKGYVAGEDGKAGFRGALVSKQGSLIAKAALAGVASGMGKAVTDQYQTISQNALGTITTIDPSKAVQGGLATGFGNAMEKVSDFYIARANETYPIIEVNAERVGDMILTAGVDFKINHIGLKRSR
jgi:conjugal transfer pilus assembly protein TraB